MQNNDLNELFDKLWDLLDGVISQSGDTIWYSDFITAHEQLVEIAHEYDEAVAEDLSKRIERNDPPSPASKPETAKGKLKCGLKT